jgi:hypothetical protein
VGPDNGLFEIVQRRSKIAQMWTITWRPERLSRSFHGRDLFAPVAARIARSEGLPGEACPAEWRQRSSRSGAAWPDDRAAIIYIDDFGNAMTGLRAELIDASQSIVARDERIPHGGIFSEVPPGQVFWYSNSCGLIEIAVNRGSAAAVWRLKIGDDVAVE